MEYAISEHLHQADCDTFVVGVYDKNQLSAQAKELDKACGGAIQAALNLGDFTGKVGVVLPIYHPANIKAERIYVVGLGKEDKFDDKQYHKVLRGLGKALKTSKGKRIAMFLSALHINKKNDYWKIRNAIEILEHDAYDFKNFKSKDKDEPNLDHLMTLVFPTTSKTLIEAELAIKHARVISQSVKMTRDLANTPGNVCTPTYMADAAKLVCKEAPSIKMHLLTEKEMEDLGMGSFLAVSQGSDEPGYMVIMEYHGGKKNEKPIALVGKGITFDTGGICLKPSSNINGMKYDMCGAASVLATIRAAAMLELPVNIVAVMACAENMPSGKAMRPDDIVTSLSGKTIEIGNTDAEGRLVLCDALTYVKRFEPETIIDIATLTGACVVALGRHASGLYANHQKLADELLHAGLECLDRAWQMPLWDEYQVQIDSKCADMINIGGPEAGSVTAACFLARFMEEENWAHLDVAGTAFRTGAEAYASGRPVPLLCEFILERARVIPK